jgi:hypothetical protein
MTQTTVLAAAQTAATSSDIVVVAGTPVSCGIFATGNIPAAVIVDLCADTPGTDNLVFKLTAQTPIICISGPGTYRAYRRDISAHGVDVGVYKEA